VKRNIKIIIAVCAGILLLVAALIALSCEDCGGGSSAVSEGNVISSTEVSPSDSSGIHLHPNETGELLADGDDLRTLRLISSKGDYLITRGEDDKLSIESLSDLLLESDFLEIVWYNSLSFGYTYSIHSDNSISLADFGLDPAALIIECEYTDGSSCRLFVGNEVVGSPGIYYFRIDGRDEIFLNEFDVSFFQGDNYWLSDDIFGDDTEDVTIGSIALSGSAFSKELKLERYSSDDKSDPLYGSNYVITSPIKAPTDNYMTTLLTDELTEMVANEAVCAHPSDKQIKEYGLDKSYAIITHQRNGNQRVLRVARVDASTLYAMADGVDCIFMLDSGSFEMISALSDTALRSNEVHVRYFDSVESIRIQAKDTDLTFTLKRTPLETDDTLFEYRAYYGDTQLTLNYYKSLLEVFNSAAAVNYGGQRDSDKPDMTVTIYFFDGYDRKEEVIRYYSAGTRRYLVTIDGVGDVVVSQMWVDKFLESAEALSENQEITP